MKRLLLLIAFLAFMCARCPAAAKPNIIVILSDDQGYGELSCHGNPVVRTPNLDRLHAESVRFTDFHVAPMCTPTRGQLMTGLDAVRNGALNVSSGRTLLRRDVAALPELLKRGGHVTGLFGKWHLGDNYPFRPQDRGFDEVVTFPSSHIGAVPDAWLNDYFDDTYLHNGRPRPYRGYTTDVFFDEAMAWMKSCKDKSSPFFTYLATAAPHSPHYVPAKYREAAAARLEAVLPKLPQLAPAQREQLARYLGMIENLDDNIGRLEAFLTAENLHENTVLIFLTDNGTTFGDQYFPCGMRGKKVTLWEGGHRVPFFIRWPGGGLGAPRDVPQLTQVQDVLPTLLDIVGASAPERVNFDGMTLLPLLRGEKGGLPDRTLFINYSRMPFSTPAEATVKMEGAAVLWQRWRFLNNRELYDLSRDPLQQRDVAADQPQIVADLRQQLEAWWKQNAAQANEPQRIIIGHDAENPTMLTACEWWNVFVDQQAQVRRGELKNGTWHLEVAQAGQYEIELRRWPRDARFALNAPAPATKLTDGELPEGNPIPIARARLRIGPHEQTIKAEGEYVTFTIPLERGSAQLHATFLDADDKPLMGAYYAHIRRL
jgi:arylsulfatase A-like enzyme